MGASDSKKQSQPDCRVIQDDENLDLHGCLESLSDMANTGKNAPLKKSSATSRALWGMSRALSAPVTATTGDSPTRPSLTRSKAVSLDHYTESPVKNISSPLSIVRETVGLDNEFLTADGEQRQPSPSIEVIPPELSEQQNREGDIRGGISHREEGISHKGSRLYVPPSSSSSSKHSKLKEKRKKLLRKVSHIEEDPVEASSFSKKHSPTPESVNNWEQIQEWMVWCIHENLDDTSEDEMYTSTSPGNRTPMHRGAVSPCLPHALQNSPLLQHQETSRTQQQLRDMHLAYQSTPAHSEGYQGVIPKLHHQRSLPRDDMAHFTEHLPDFSASTSSRNLINPSRHYGQPTPPQIHIRPGNRLPGHSGSPLTHGRGGNRGVFGRNQVSSIGDTSRGCKPKTKNMLSLDSHLLKLSGQSSFESSGSSRMNSFDSTGTHNDKL